MPHARASATPPRSVDVAFEQATGVWAGGRVGTYRGVKEPLKVGVGATVFGANGTARCDNGYDYKPLVAEIATFFRTGDPPVPAEETIEIFAFLTAWFAGCPRHDPRARIGRATDCRFGQSVVRRAIRKAHRPLKAAVGGTKQRRVG